MAGAFAKIEGHEQLCAERYKNIHGRLNLLFKVIGWGGALAFSVTLALAGWGLSRLAEGQAQQLRALQQVKAEVIAR